MTTMTAVKQVERVYPLDGHYEVADKHFLNTVDEIVELKNLDKNMSDIMLKDLCNQIREDLGIDNYMNIMLARRNDDNKRIGIIHIFPVKADEHSVLVSKYDEEKKMPYIEV